MKRMPEDVLASMEMEIAGFGYTHGRMIDGPQVEQKEPARILQNLSDMYASLKPFLSRLNILLNNG